MMTETETLWLLLFLLLWSICLWQGWSYGRLGRLSRQQECEPLRGEGLPGVSVVVVVHNQQEELRQLLPVLLAQRYPAPYEVIVSDMHSTDDTLAMLEGMEELYPHLHHTFCPATARDISLQRLALTLGIRSANYEWVSLLQGDCTVGGSDWLLSAMQPAGEGTDAILGLTRYATATGWSGLSAQFFRLWQQMMWLPHALRHAPYRAEGTSLSLRKDFFMKHQGFASSAQLMVGGEALFVNHHVERGRVAVNVRPAAIVSQRQPDARLWRQERLFFMETRAHLKHTLAYRLRYALVVLAFMMYPMCALSLNIYAFPNPWVLVPVLVCWLTFVAIRQTCLHRTTSQLGITSFRLSLFALQHSIPLWDASAWTQWLFTRKKTFRKKFV